MATATETTMRGATAVAPVKHQVVDKPPKRFGQMKFGIQSLQDITNQAVLEVSDRTMYDLSRGREPTKNGVLDKRLGISSKIATCATCDLKLQDCPGHFGHVRLPLPAFHIGFIRFTMKVLQEICKDCSRVLLAEPERRAYLRELRRDIDNMRRQQILKKVNEQCRKSKMCPYCGAINGQIRKLGALKLVHDKFVAFNKSTSIKKQPPSAKLKFDESFAEAKLHNSDLDKHVKKAMEDLNPLRVLNLFKQISPTDCELLGMDSTEGRPEMFLWQYIPAPPVCIRPSVAQEGASNEDDLTTRLSEIVWACGLIRNALQKGTNLGTIMEQWEFLQLQIAVYVNSDVPGLQATGLVRPMRGFCQRLKGKQGRFRGNLSGKRVDFSGRTVISPDPNLGVDQVAVPMLVALNLTYPERVQRENIDKLRACVKNGPSIHPGAQQVIKQDGDQAYKTSLRFGDRERVAKELRYGDVVERHLEDGDVVLFNRQPSLHKLSIMSHLAKIRPWRTFRLNECVCGPYNADFDGDEMNLHVPQTEEARAEAINLMGVKNNLATPKNGEPVIAATQDFITAAYILSGKDMFFDRKTVLMRPNSESPVKINLDAKCREYVAPDASSTRAPDMCPKDGWLVVRNSVVMCGRMDKSTVGDGKKDSIFYVILRDFGPDAAVVAMNRLAKLCARMLTNQGFSIGIGDVFPSEKLTEAKQKLVHDAVAKTDGLISDYNDKKLAKSAGCSMEETLENSISGTLSKVRDAAGKYCIATLSTKNAPWIMASSGSKGSNINVAQMIALVGQQIIGGSRVADGFQDRTLPHFHKLARQPASKGFVANSFYTGLLATEFIFHAMSGREGLVDTAVKTAETGYMSRRLMKSLEDLSAQYDDTVRTSEGGIVQFQFGADKLDPVDMEGSAVPVNFERTWSHAENITWSHTERALLPFEMLELCDRMIDKQRKMYPRKGLLHGESLTYHDETDYGLDEHESSRLFLTTIEAFVTKLATKLANTRKAVGLKEYMEKPKLSAATIDKQEKGSAARTHTERVAKVSYRTLEAFITLCLEKFKKAHVEPGHAVGAVGAQSIGEPGTQMTLKTFHFAGVAGMSITQGVPRIKEIINASKTISTPVVTCPLENKFKIEAARIVRGRIEKTYVEDVLRYVDDEWEPSRAYITLAIDTEALESMHLGIGLYDIKNAIVKAKKLKILDGDLRVYPIDGTIEIAVGHPDPSTAKKTVKSKVATVETAADLLTRVSHLKRVLPSVPISGYSEATRAIIQITEEKGEKNEEGKPLMSHAVLVEGYGLRQCMNTEGVIGTQVRSNSVVECRDVLGIEAARTTIAIEIGAVMNEMNIDPRHMQLLADVMTYKGEVLGITRFGLSKMRDSVLQLASFEKTPDHLFEAAANMKKDKIEGVSEKIIMGQTMSVGTGAFQVVRRLGLGEEHLQRLPTAFEDAWAAESRDRRDLRKKKATTALA
ncbi:DNA-directed RNA polymerase III largest subunit [Apiospora sp. TS-2023a]